MLAQAIQGYYGMQHILCIYRNEATTDTRWNSIFRQLKAVVNLDQTKLSDVLRESSNSNLILITKDVSVLTELIEILCPFAEATDLAQGEEMITISCVVQVVLALRKLLIELSKTVRHHATVVQELKHQLDDRFADLLQLLDIPMNRPDSKRLAFGQAVFIMAAVADLRYGYRWLIDHPGTEEDKESLRHRCNGELILCCTVWDVTVWHGVMSMCSDKTIYQGMKMVRSKDLQSTDYIYSPKYVMLNDKS